MKHVFLVASIIGLMLACNNETETPTDAATAPAATTTPTDLPYTATYSSSWDTNVSDADLKTVLMSYKHWADGNIDALMNTMGDSTWVDMSDGVSANYSNADLRKRWASSRDSLSSVEIQMDAWHKMRSEKQKDSIQKRQQLGAQLLKEIQANYPGVYSCSYAETLEFTDSAKKSTAKPIVAFTTTPGRLSNAEKTKIRNWLQIRLQQKEVNVYFDEAVR